MTIDGNGNLVNTAGFKSGSSSGNSGYTQWNGATSGGAGIGAAAIAGTPVLYLMPATAGSAGQTLQDTGVATCPALPTGSPATCHQMAWAATTVTGAPNSWSIVNGAVLTNNPSIPLVALSIPYNSSINWRLATRPLTIPYTLQAAMTCQLPNPAVDATTCGFYITDGTKLEGFEYLGLGSSPSGLRLETMSNVNTDTGTLAGPAVGLAGPANFEVKIVNDSTHRTFYYYSNGAWVQFYQENSGAFLTETAIGFGGIDVDSATTTAAYVGMVLTYWSGI